MNVHLFGLVAVAVAIGFLVVFTAPVWFAAKLVGARRATLLRSAVALFTGLFGTFVSALVAPLWILLLSPLCFLLAFRSILGTSLFGAFLLGMLALVGYGLLAHFLGGEVQLIPAPTTTV